MHVFKWQAGVQDIKIFSYCERSIKHIQGFFLMVDLEKQLGHSSYSNKIISAQHKEEF